MFTIDLIPILLILHCCLINFFKTFISAQGVLLFSIGTFIYILLIATKNIITILQIGSFIYLDYGQ